MPWRKPPPPPPKVDTDAELAEQVRQLVDFAHVNALAVKKLAKKYDKVHRTGERLLSLVTVLFDQGLEEFLILLIWHLVVLFSTCDCCSYASWS